MKPMHTMPTMETVLTMNQEKTIYGLLGKPLKAYSRDKRPCMEKKSLNLGFKSNKKVKYMNNQAKEIVSKVSEQKSTQTAKELAISSKNKTIKTKEVKIVTKSKKRAHKKQRKGKSLLTSFRINRMTRYAFVYADNGKRFSLNMNRGSFHGKYA